MMDSNNDSRVIRAPSLKRGKNDERLCDRIKLKKVLGLTVCSNAALDVSPSSGLLAYPAGCTVVLFNAKKLQQTHLLNTSKKTITAVAYSHCGRYIATGECGINPAIKVWELDNQIDISDNSSGGTVISEFLGHKYAITCVAFSPTGKYLVSVGSQHDMIVNVFDWKLNLKIASNKVSAKVSAVSFSQDGNYFVTVGNRHVKFWYLEGNRKYKEPIPLMGRSAILGELRNNDFCAVACGKGESADSTYAITRVGHLVEFNSRRLLDKWVACRTTSANCICVTTNYILVGCSEAIIRIFNSLTLEYITTLPRTHYLGVDVAQGIHINHIMNVPPNAKYPDTIAMVYDETRSKVTCVYNDHSLYVWDLRDIRRVGKSHSFLYHSACIWGVETVPSSSITATTGTGTIDSSVTTLPDDSFVTCSSDDTIRVWGLDGCQNNELYRKNIYSKELLKIIYIDDEMNFIKDIDNPILSTTEKSTSYDGRNGVRCIKINSERNHLASGDRSGNIRVYNLNSLKLITMIEAHDSEVLCLEYTNEKIQRKLLASASRDRLIHVFDVNQNYKILQTLDDHSSSITSIKFIGQGIQGFQMISCGADKSIVFRTFQNNLFSRGTNCSGKTTLYDMEIDSNAKHILTACQDRNIRVYGTQNGKHTKTFKGSHSDEGSLIKLCLDPSGIYIATSCTDKTLSVYDYYSNECMARMYGHSELVTGLRFTNDCRHLISASGDGCIFVWQVPHDMVVTMQARLSQQRIRSGQMPPPAILRPLSVNSSNTFDKAYNMHHPQQQQHIVQQQFKFESERTESSSNHIFIGETSATPNYKLAEVGQLPQWAKRKNSESENTFSTSQQQSSQQQQQSQSSSVSQSQILPVPKARGRWAQRGQLDAETLDSKNLPEVSTSATTIATPHIEPITPTFNFAISNNNSMQTSDYNSASSKEIIYHHSYLSEDSSLDSGVENRRKTERRLNEQKRKPQNLRFEANNDNDGDVEDISDGERTSSDHGMMFYPTAIPGTPTEFKVNAMNEEELRKSVRRKHFEKVGLNLHPHSAASTGTGTSDTEDEGSTPSGENAERSLASTLGGSSESIPQQTSSSFLQSALDGPGNLSDRGGRNRRSISAKHNNLLTYSKSYTNSKKEELMKVINEAKQKLEDVGYRSNLRGSLSVSDLSHANPLDYSSRLGRINRAGNSNNSSTKNSIQNNNYFNCAAPKSVLTQNFNIIRQIQRTYPPYPHEIGTYNNHEVSQMKNEYYHHQANIQKPNRPCSLDLPPPPLQFSDHEKQQQQQHTTTSSKIQTQRQLQQQQQQHKSILKNHKSCPVSPVHEELDWTNLSSDSRNTTCLNFVDKNGKQQRQQEENQHENQQNDQQQQQQKQQQKRHSMYSDDAKIILDMIHSDTEKMIAEIAQKYGDLDVYDQEKCIKDETTEIKTPTNRTMEFEHLKEEKPLFTNELAMDAEDKDNFSSDSLEDCSLSFDIDKYGNNKRNIQNRKSVCKKHSQNLHKMKNTINQTLPTRSVSDYFIYPEFYSRCPSRNVSLSDILVDCENEEQQQQRQQQQQLNNTNPFLKSARHSSASFFLVGYSERKSQDSILSDDFSNTTSLYNSMDSILSDESDCKSAPLEVLFNRARRGDSNAKQYSNYDSNYYEKYGGTGELTSKSYGSSPNNNANSFDFYMQNRHNYYSFQEDIKFYSPEYTTNNLRLYENENYQNITRPKSPRLCSTTSSAFKVVSGGGGGGIPISNTFPVPNNKYSLSYDLNDDDIPTLFHKNEEYSSAMNRSLRKEFSDQRCMNNSNPLYSEIDSDKQFGLKSNRIEDQQQQQQEQKFTMRKSCSFDIDMNDGRKVSQYVPTRFEKNLRKFEKDQRQQHHHNHNSHSSRITNTLEMDYVPHKPPVASRRSSSMRSRSRNRSKGRYNTVDQINISHPVDRQSNEIRDFVNPNATAATTTITTTDVAPTLSSTSPLKKNKSEEKIFELFVSEKGTNDNDNMDSLELYTKPDLFKANSVDSLDDICSNSGGDGARNEKNHKCIENKYIQFEDIEKKINIINKLVKMEELKLEQERHQRETRMKPFECDSKQKGYVKSLTMNFDKLVKNIEEEVEFEKKRQLFTTNKVKRNFSLPDVLEGAKLKSFHFQNDHGNDNDRLENDDDDDDDENVNGNKRISNAIMKTTKRNEGNPKSLLSVHIDDSSIRRACSLSDLCVGKGHNNTVTSTPQKPASNSSNSRSTAFSRSSGKRNTALNHKSNSNMGSRSVSVGVLNQGSDSETDTLESRDVGVHAYASPNRTSFSVANNSRQHSKGNSGNSNRRKTISVSSSSMNLSTTGQDDSSSEETPVVSSTHSTKPVVPPRPRNLMTDHKKMIHTNGGSLGSSSATTVVTGGKMKGNSDLLHNDHPTRDTESGGDGNDSTSQLCSNIINMLNTTTNAVLQLHSRLKYNEEESGTKNNYLLLKELENAVIMTQSMLTRITNNRNDSNSHNTITTASTLATDHDNNSSTLENSDYLYMMNKCADILNRVRNNSKSDE